VKDKTNPHLYLCTVVEANPVITSRFFASVVRALRLLQTSFSRTGLYPCCWKGTTWERVLTWASTRLRVCFYLTNWVAKSRLWVQDGQST